MKGLYKLMSMALLLAVGLLVVQGSALAHPTLVRTEPPANSVLAEPPAQVQLWFNEPVEARASRIAVYDSGGKRVSKGPIEAAGDPKTIRVSLDAIGPGRYTVDWLILSTLDGHVISGKFTFSVRGAASPGKPAPVEATGPVAPSEGSSESAVSSALPSPQEIITRWASLLAGAMLFAGFTLALFSRRPSQETFDAAEISLPPLGLRLRANMLEALVLLALAAPATLLVQATSIDDLSISSVGVLLGGTRFGFVWLTRGGLIAALALVLYLWKGENHGWRVWAGMVLGAALLLTFSLSSHAAALAEEGLLPIFADWLHLLAAAAWLGGLILLVRVFLPAVHGLKKKLQGSLGAPLLVPFSRLAMLSVSALILTGIYSAWVEVGSLDSLFASPYGKTLLVKMGFALPALLLGFLNFRRVSRLAKSGPRAEALPSSRMVWSEAMLGMGVLLVVAVLVALPPGRGPTDALPGSGALLMALTIVLVVLFMVVLARWWRGAFVAALERSLTGAGPSYKPGPAGQDGAGRPAQNIQATSTAVPDRNATKKKRRR